MVWPCNREMRTLSHMLGAVAVRIPRGPARDVDGATIRALRYSLGLSMMDFGSLCGKEKVTVYRWETGGVDEITWLGILSKSGRAPDWKPPPDLLARARTEVEDLRRAAASRKKAGDDASE